MRHSSLAPSLSRSANCIAFSDGAWHQPCLPGDGAWHQPCLPGNGAWHRILSQMNHEVFAALGEALSRGEEAALVTIVSSNGSTPQRVGAKMLVFADGRIVGTVGGGCYEHDAIGKARMVLTTRKPTTVKYDLNDDFAEETGLVCGGQMEVFIEPIEASPAVYIFGAGHVGYYLAKIAHEAGFGVHVIDDRAAFANTERFPFAASVVVDDIPQWLQQSKIPSTAYAVIV